MTVFLQEMTHAEVSRKAEEGVAVIIPFGSMEQHGLHLPLGTDLLIALEISKRVAEKTGSIVAPVLWVSLSKEHMAFKGTISLESETLMKVMHDVVRSLSLHGFRRIVVINTHGGSDAALRSAALEANTNFDVSVLYIGPSEVSSLLPESIQRELEENMDIHAGVFETSVVNLVRPDLIRRDQPSKPKMNIERHVLEALNLAKGNPTLRASILSSVLAKFNELSDNGSLTLLDPLNHWGKAETEVVLEEIAEKIAEVVRKWR